MSVLYLWQMFGTAVFGFGLYMMMNSKVSSLIPSLASLNLANILFIIGIIITCVSFLGFLGALKENRCLLIAVCDTTTRFNPTSKYKSLTSTQAWLWRFKVNTFLMLRVFFSLSFQFFILLFLLMLVELAAACFMLVYEGEVGTWVVI